jgi:transcriptional regulator with XRE-family HTH domain
MGIASQRVARNIRILRQYRNLSYAELARRLAAAGHPILDTGLMKLEKGDRRVDVDDLTALAEALQVEACALLGDITLSIEEGQ